MPIFKLEKCRFLRCSLQLPSPDRVGDAGLQLPGLAGVAAARAPGQTGASRFFPLGRIADANHWHQSIGNCLIGYVSWPLNSSSARAVSTSTAPRVK